MYPPNLATRVTGNCSHQYIIVGLSESHMSKNDGMIGY